LIYVRLTNIYVEEYIVEPFSLVLIYRLSFTLMQTWQHQKHYCFGVQKYQHSFIQIYSYKDIIQY